MTYKNMAIIAILALSSAMPAPAQDIIGQIADGTAWSTDGPQGGVIQITLFSDGTGKAGTGLLSRRLTWTRNGEQFCISGLPGAASGCMKLTKTAEGYAGLRADGSALRLWR